ncbi:MAG: hypothetical protein AB9828_07865 [Sphaerochaetaceae bacterium]
MKTGTKIIGVATLILVALSLFLTIGSDTAFGKVEVSHLVLATGDGDELNCLLYRPRTATADNPAPAVMLAHGGNDMAEQMTSYCIELSRRGYVVITRDAIGSHNSDSSTSPSEMARVEAAGYRPMGLRAVLTALQNYSFVNQDYICAMGHSLGGTNAMSLAVDTGALFLSINLGQNMYGKGTYGCYDYNYDVIVGDADEAVMMNTTPQNDTYYSVQTPVLKRVFFGDYKTPDDKLPDIEFGKKYQVTGSDGNTYYRTAYRPASTHAYYLCTQDAVQTVVFAIASEVGVGLEPEIKSYADHTKIKTIWQMHDIGYFLTFLAILGMMFFVASALLETHAFSSLKLKKQNTASLAFPKRSWQRWVFAAVLFVSPLLLFKPGILGATEKFVGLFSLKPLWLLGGNNNVIIAWQWYCAILMLALFIAYHFIYGKKAGGNKLTYGFATSDTGKLNASYIGKALAFGLITVGSAYLLLACISAYTKEGIHIGTFMLSTIHPRRTLAVFIYFLFQIPYFLVSSLAYKSIGITEGGDDTKNILKTIGLSVLFSLCLLFLYWLWFVSYLQIHDGLPQWFYVRDNLRGFLMISGNKIVVYNMLLLPMCIGMAVANALNIYVVKKTNSIWTGLFTALLWGTWMLVSCGDLAKMFY